MKHAKGEFTVKLDPQPLADTTSDPLLGRMSIDKTWRGALEGASRGEMLSARTPIQGSAGYVAIERFTGSLDGRRGSFVLQHSGTMARGEQQLVINVVPDSGSGEFAGLTGTMTIRVADGKHEYEFRYTLRYSGDRR